MYDPESVRHLMKRPSEARGAIEGLKGDFLIEDRFSFHRSASALPRWHPFETTARTKRRLFLKKTTCSHPRASSSHPVARAIDAHRARGDARASGGDVVARVDGRGGNGGDAARRRGATIARRPSSSTTRNRASSSSSSRALAAAAAVATPRAPTTRGRVLRRRRVLHVDRGARRAAAANSSPARPRRLLARRRGTVAATADARRARRYRRVRPRDRVARGDRDEIPPRRPRADALQPRDVPRASDPPRRRGRVARGVRRDARVDADAPRARTRRLRGRGEGVQRPRRDEARRARRQLRVRRAESPGGAIGRVRRAERDGDGVDPRRRRAHDRQHVGKGRRVSAGDARRFAALGRGRIRRVRRRRRRGGGGAVEEHGGRRVDGDAAAAAVALRRGRDDAVAFRSERQVRSIHWSPYDPVGVVNADP